jgi:hypothetical protein
MARSPLSALRTTYFQIADKSGGWPGSLEFSWVRSGTKLPHHLTLSNGSAACAKPSPSQGKARQARLAEQLSLIPGELAPAISKGISLDSPNRVP